MRHGKHRGLERWSRIGLFILAGLVLAVGFQGTRWFGQRADRHHREDLLAQATAIARTVDPQQVKALSFSGADLEKPEFQRLRTQMRAFARAVGLRSLYSMALRDGTLLFGPESLDEDDPFASPPGTVYEKPSPLDFEVFRTGRALTQGPETDEYGTFISALAPVLDPHTGEVLLAVGIDVEAGTWQAAIVRAQRTPILLALALLAILLAGAAVLGWRSRLPADRHGGLRYVEAVLCAAVGLTFTLAAAGMAHDAERRSRHASFSALARAQTAGVGEDLRELSGRLEDLVLFFQGSERVDRNEFRAYVEGFARQGLSQDWVWVPEVPAASVRIVEAEARQDGLIGFEVRRLNEQDSPIPASESQVSYPILYHASPAGRQGALGFDLGTEPLCRTALEEAARSRMASASDPVLVPGLGGEHTNLLVFRSVFGAAQRGFVGVAVGPEALLMQSLRRSGSVESGVSASLFLLSTGGPPRLLGGTAPEHNGAACWGTDFGGLSTNLPIFLFGRAYALLVHPEPLWLDANPLKSGGATAAAGLVLTTLLTTLVAFVSNRRHLLERQVRARTASLRESEEKYRILVEKAGEAVFVLQDGLIRFYNDRSRQIIGHPPEELTFRPFVEFVHPDDREKVSSLLLRPRTDGPPTPAHAFRILDHQGNIRWAELSTAALSWEGKPATLNFMSDVTDRMALEDQFRQAQKMESVGRLAGGVAHDFNNMLAVIIGYAEMAKKLLDPAQPLYGHLEQIHQAAQRSADLTRQLLTFARRQTVKPQVLDLNAAVAGTLKMLRRLLGEDLELVWKPGQDLWPVEMDPSQVDQVLANLSVNARDAIHGVGTVTIETTNVVLDEAYGHTHAGFEAGEFVLLTVSDTGSGMDKQTLEHLFEPFFTTKDLGKGTGLGLATVYGIVKQNDGLLNVYSEPGRGTAFRIYLPRSRSSATETVEAAARGDEPRGGKETILLVEDEQAILALGRAILERFGYEILLAENPSQALVLAEQHKGRIDLLLTDVVMPEMNGRDLKERIEQHRPGIKALFMSGYTAEAITRHDVLGQGVHFLQKPFSVRSLASRVREVLEQR